MQPNQYKEKLNNVISSEYKKASKTQEQNAFKSDKKIAKDLGISDRVEVMSKSESYMTAKDHKPDFLNNPKFRLLNSNKGNLGKVSKEILQNINDQIRRITKSSPWKNSKGVIDWFNKIDSKDRTSFIQFDIYNFYPSITEDLLSNALEWALGYVEITEEEKSIIMSTKQNLLYSNGVPWVKKGDKCWDVTMGSWDGAEVCDLTGLFILSQCQNLGANFGLYRDDGLGECRKRPQQIENIKKQLCNIFKENGLKITIEANKKVVHFWTSP